MCGIAGWYRRGDRAVPASVLEEQCRRIFHRGPDDDGLLTDRDFGFGMRRLSIIDIEGGHQPMETEDGRFVIVFNGEIYNHPDLRRQIGSSYSFRTRSDTESVLGGFVLWGDDVWERLEGMFAVAIWDRHKRSLTLARDRSGMKPLHYSEQDGGLAFASEVEALLNVPGFDFPIDPLSADQFFRFGYTLPGRSIYARVKTLDPGHVLKLKASGEPEARPYWTPKLAHSERRSEAEYVAELRSRWIDTVRSHLLADVEVGAFLSGGIDSSAVVAAMSQVMDRPVRTFAIGFPDKRYDESAHAERVARHFRCNHTSHMVDLKRAIDILPEVQKCYGEPFADPAAIPTWYMSQLAAREVKVVLSGDGGDEIFYGYRRQITEHRLASIPKPVKAAGAYLLRLPPLPARRLNYKIQSVQKALRVNAFGNGFERFFAKKQVLSPELIERIYDPAFAASVSSQSTPTDLARRYFCASDISQLSDIDQFGLAEFEVSLPQQMLTKVDRASMAHSLEVRMPMLGPSFVDWAFTLPADMKIRGTTGKYILRKAVEAWLPDDIVKRPKQGFALPLPAWFAGDFGAFAHEAWHSSGAPGDGFLLPAIVDQVFAEHRSGRRNHSRFLYSLAMYGLWRSGARAETKAA
jgi:asparagine synthase (glutamine-hydrolysing)